MKIRSAHEQDDLKSLCREAGAKADYFQPHAALARDAEAAARRTRRWRVSAIAGFGFVAVAVMASQYSNEPAPGATQEHRAPSSERCHAIGCNPADSAQTPLSKPLPTTPEAVVRAMMANPIAAPATSEPATKSPPEPATQAEKELRESQPDGSC